MTLDELNRVDKPALSKALATCCGATAWVEKMATVFPVADEHTLLLEAERAWYSCTKADWLEAFTYHPKIGDISSLREKFTSSSKWAQGEQAAVKRTSDEVLQALATGNREYEEKFGYIFIVCATGKSAEEMLRILQERLTNSTEEEILIAMEEQNKITKLRLQKLLAS